MGVIFDGREYARRVTERLRRRVRRFEIEHGRKPKLVTVFDPDSGPAKKYTLIKARKAEEIGVILESVECRAAGIEERIKGWNRQEAVDGIMVQVPFRGDQELVELIDPAKDVDGLRDDSLFVPAVVRAVEEILGLGLRAVGKAGVEDLKVVVLGSRGLVGGKLMEQFCGVAGWRLRGMDADSLDADELREADVVVSATGAQGLFGAEMVKEGVCLIDVGYPVGDFALAVADRAGFYTPVPGGVGPVTVTSLFANLLGR